MTETPALDYHGLLSFLTLADRSRIGGQSALPPGALDFLIAACRPPDSTPDTMCVLSGTEVEVLVAGYLCFGTLEIVSRALEDRPCEADHPDGRVAAFLSLCSRGFVRHDRGASFLLTEAGWHHARNAIAEYLREKALWAIGRAGLGRNPAKPAHTPRGTGLGRRMRIS